MDIAPFGEQAADLRHGIATSVLANVNRNAEKRPEAYKATDFIYWHDANREPEQDKLLLDPEEHSRQIKRLLFRA